MALLSTQYANVADVGNGSYLKGSGSAGASAEGYGFCERVQCAEGHRSNDCTDGVTVRLQF